MDNYCPDHPELIQIELKRRQDSSSTIVFHDILCFLCAILSFSIYMIINRYIAVIVFLFTSIFVQVYAQSNEDSFKHWSVGLSGALNNYDAWELEPSISYNLVRYAGAGVGILFTKTMGNDSYGGYSADKTLRWFLSDDLNYSLAIRPEIHLATPAVYLDKDHDLALSLRVSPGLTIPFPTNLNHDVEYIPNQTGVTTPVKYDQVKNTGAKACYFHLKTALALEIDVITLSLGYNFSNFDLYGGSRNTIVEGEKLKPTTKIQYMHSVFLNLSYSF